MRSGSSGNKNSLVCDTGPLLALARISFLPVVHELFPDCLITDVVQAECQAKPHSYDALAIQTAIGAGMLRLLPTPPVREALSELDEGERSAIEVAIRCQCIVLLDEKRGRQLCRQLGMRVIGSLGVILLAKQRSHIKRVMPYVRALVESGYYLSPALMERSRILAGE